MRTKLSPCARTNEGRSPASVVWTLLTLLAFPLCALADVSEVETFEFEMGAGGTLSVENINGDITIIGGSGNTVEITATKKGDNQDYLDGIEIQVSADERRIRIRTEHPREEKSWFGFGNGNGSVTYEITAPADIHIDSVDTVNGEIEVEGISGDVSAETTNGEIYLTGLTGSLDADTTNGTIDATFVRLEGNQRVKAETVNGRVQLRLPANASARIDADTVNGGIDADDFGLHVDKGFLGRDLEGEIGGGDARVDLNTVNGSIRIREN